MATISGVGTWIAKGLHKKIWEGLSASNVDGSVHSAANLPDKTVQVLGDFGAGGTILIQGSNDGGTTWFTLTDVHGNACSYTAAGGDAISENPLLIRPFWSAGTGGDVDVIITSQSAQR